MNTEERLHRVEVMALAALELATQNSRRITHMNDAIRALETNFNAALATIDGYTTGIANDLAQVSTKLQSLQSQIDNGDSITSAQLSPLVDALNARADALKAVATSADALVPPAPAPVVPAPEPAPTTDPVPATDATPAPTAADPIAAPAAAA